MALTEQEQVLLNKESGTFHKLQMGTRLARMEIQVLTPVNAVSASTALAAADLAIMGNGDLVTFAGDAWAKAGAPAEGFWTGAVDLAALIDDLDAWTGVEAGGAVNISSSIRGAALNGNVASLVKLEDTTVGGEVAAKATATIAAATIARLANGDTVEFFGSTFTKAAATSVENNRFLDQAGLILCIDDLADWVAVNNGGAVDITAAANGVEFNDEDITVTLRRTTASGVNGTIGFRGQVCADTNFFYRAVADNTIVDNNWRRVALGGVY